MTFFLLGTDHRFKVIQTFSNHKVMDGDRPPGTVLVKGFLGDN